MRAEERAPPGAEHKWCEQRWRRQGSLDPDTKVVARGGDALHHSSIELWWGGGEAMEEDREKTALAGGRCTKGKDREPNIVYVRCEVHLNSL